jgi:hypothetical protein
MAPSATSPPATAFARISEAPTAFRATSAAFTAFLLICAAPTLFFDSVTAAYELPPRAMNSAASATAIAGLGRWSRRRGSIFWGLSSGIAGTATLGSPRGVR